jgi:acetyltransferase-like isoleucine patch superfamily enzyme
MIEGVVLPRPISVLFLGAYRFAHDAWAKSFSTAIGGSFAAFGRKTVIEPPFRLGGERRISIGSGVFIGANSWLQALEPGDGIAISIGDGTSIAGNCVISSAQSVVLAPKVLIARGVYISDHIHEYGDTTRPVLEQGIGQIRPVLIGEGAWLGENVVVAPGVSIGRGAVVGANAVVVDDVPDHSLAVGVPARVIRHFGAVDLEQVRA